jgi:anthranilate synthase component 1
VTELAPTLEEFRKLAVERRVIPVYRRLLADAETAIGLYRKLARNRPGTYLLESAEQGVWSRYSFVGVRAAATLTEQNGQAAWTGHAPIGLPTGGDPLAAVRETLRLLHTPHDEGLPPFTSGLVGYLSYDAVRRVERLPDSCIDDLRSRSWRSSWHPILPYLIITTAKCGWLPTRSTSTTPTSESMRRTPTRLLGSRQ